MKRISLVLLAVILFLVSNVNAQIVNKDDSLKIHSAFYYFNGLLPGAMISILHDGKEVYYNNFGLANNDTKEKLTREHIFYISSMGKIYTSMAILKLVEMNKLSLDENINSIFPDFPEYGRNINIKNLLSHTSGLLHYDPEKTNSNKDVLKFLYSQDSLQFTAGSNWGHSNSDYALLASIIEKRSNKSYQKFLKKYIFKKIKLNKKQFFEELNGDPIVSGHIEKSWSYSVSDQLYEKIYGEKGFFLSMDDLIKTENAIFYNKNNPVISYSESFNKVLIKTDIEINYGYGWYLIPQDDDQVDNSVYWIAGTGHGFQNVMVHFPNEKLTVIILINRNQMYNSILKMAVEIGKLIIE